MMGVAVDPNFNKNRRVYVASTSDKYHGSVVVKLTSKNVMVTL